MKAHIPTFLERPPLLLRARPPAVKAFFKVLNWGKG